MTITRAALIVTCPGQPGSDYLDGVNVDARNYRRLLESAHGGSWDMKKEVTFLQCASPDTVRNSVRWVSQYDYSLIVFSGHGWYSSHDNDTILELGNDRMPLSDLRNGSTKRTIIVDCCRVIFNETITETRKYAASLRARTSPDPEKCRRLFLNTVASMPDELSILYSCSQDERAGDNATEGGTYTTSLINAANDWAQNQAQQPSPNGWLSVVDAHRQAFSNTIRIRPMQNPTIERARSGPYAPFAVFAA